MKSNPVRAVSLLKSNSRFDLDLTNGMTLLFAMNYILELGHKLQSMSKDEEGKGLERRFVTYISRRSRRKIRRQRQEKKIIYL